MTEFERINLPRQAKLIDMVRVIEKSARSNGADTETVRALFMPVVEAMGMAGAIRRDEPEQVDIDTLTGPRRDFAITCSKIDRHVRASNDLTEAIVALSKAFEKLSHQS